jgi:hypothetical protein
MIDPDDAAVTAKALGEAAASVAVRQLRYELRARATEWDRAVTTYMELRGDGEDAVIELVGAVGRGMLVNHDRWGWCRVMRKLERGSDISLHMDSPDTPAGWYLNFMDPTSPCVVKL